MRSHNASIWVTKRVLKLISCFFFIFVLQRLEKLSLKWDIAKNDVKQDQHQMLKDKVLLQQQLIKKQDALAQAKREDADNEARKVCITFLGY